MVQVDVVLDGMRNVVSMQIATGLMEASPAEHVSRVLSP